MKLLHWWITILENKSPLEAALLSAIGAATVVIVFFMARFAQALWRYRPVPKLRTPKDPRPAAPRAAGSPHRRIA